MPEDFRTYDLRHTCASLMIAAGAHPRALMERLGHKDIKTTLNVYGHLLPELQEELSDRLDTIYRKGAARRPAASVHELVADARSPRASAGRLGERRFGALFSFQRRGPVTRKRHGATRVRHRIRVI